MDIDQKAVVQTIGTVAITVAVIMVIFWVFLMYPYTFALVSFSIFGLLLIAAVIKGIYLMYASSNRRNKSSDEDGRGR